MGIAVFRCTSYDKYSDNLSNIFHAIIHATPLLSVFATEPKISCNFARSVGYKYSPSKRKYIKDKKKLCVD
jgi:hypothetical protein